MLQAKQSPYAKLIFRETFNSEQSVRENGGVATNVVFDRGRAVLNGANALIKYQQTRNLGTSYSFVFKGKLTKNTSSMFAGFNAGNYILFYNSGVFYSEITGNGFVQFNWTRDSNEHTFVITRSGTAVNLYIDGVNIGGQKTFTGNNPWNLPITIGSVEAGGFYYQGEMTLSEIYDKALTASEVKNLYDNDWNSEVTGLNGQPIKNIIINGTFDNDVSGWGTTRGTLTWNPSKYCENVQNSGVNNDFTIQKSGALTIGQKYIIKFRAKSLTSNARPRLITAHWTNITHIQQPALTTEWQNYYFIATTKEPTFFLYMCDVPVPTGTRVDLDDIEVYELQPELILDFDSTRGQLIDKTGKNTLTAEDVNIKKTGSNWASEYNALTSRLNCGSDFIGNKAVTVCGWFNAKSFGEGTFGRIIDNDKFHIFTRITDVCLGVISATPTTAVSAANTITFNKNTFFAVTRKIDGKVSIYLGDTKTAPTLSGAADQNSGTPVAGTTNVIIGNRNDQTRTYDGTIPIIKVYEGILDLETITNIWSETRKHIK